MYCWYAAMQSLLHWLFIGRSGANSSARSANGNTPVSKGSELTFVVAVVGGRVENHGHVSCLVSGNVANP